MAVSSLSRMTVPLASDQSSPSQGLLMPKLKYRFRVVFENFGTEGSGSVPVIELTKQVVDFTRPSISFSNIDVPVYNSTIKLAGKYSWENLTCTLRDDAGGNVSKLVGEQLQKQLDFMEMSSAASGIDYKFLTRFEVLDGGNGAKTPIALETWEIYGCYLQSVNYGDMNYGTSEAATVALTIAFDNANQINSAGVAVGVGQAINTTVNNVATGAG